MKLAKRRRVKNLIFCGEKLFRATPVAPIQLARRAAAWFIIGAKRIWWNWQTRYFEVVVPQGVQVQVLLCAPIISRAASRRRLGCFHVRRLWPVARCNHSTSGGFEIARRAKCRRRAGN